jgi:hypothetical protein
VAKIQTIYNQLNLFVGPAPSSGYHFISDDLALNNDYSVTISNYSLLFPINRIQSTSFSFESPRTNISQLGNLGTIARPILSEIDVSLNIDYYLMGLINEARFGMLVNCPSGNNYTGLMTYGTGRVSLLSGFYTRNQEREFGTWPPRQREPRNIFITARKNSSDYNDITGGGGYKQTEIDVYSFGDAFMNSYSCQGGINEIPRVSTSFTCSNIELYGSGYTCDIPALNPQTNNIYSGRKFNVPNNFQGIGLPTVLLPKDIVISITQRSNNSENLTDLLLDYGDIKLQSFNFNIDLNRSPLYGIGHKLPLDKQIKFPVISNLNFSLLPGDNKVGSINSLLKRDENYDISLKLKYQSNTTGWAGVAIQYDFIGAKFNGFSDDISIQNRRNNNLSFTTELNPLDITNGLFITGFLSIPDTSSEITYLGDDFPTPDSLFDNLLTQDGDLFTISLGGYHIKY